MSKIKFHNISFGCDPEFFFKKNGAVIGAEKVLPEQGFKVRPKTAKRDSSVIIIDGVQAELNPAPHGTREMLADEIAWCLSELNRELVMKGIDADFSQSVELSQEELDAVSDKYKRFGCTPSKNPYVEGGISKIEVNPLVFRGRSAGGHLHLGIPKFASPSLQWALKTPNHLVPMLDLIVGNTCVLIDRSEANIARRKVYGKAGEHRTPKYGVEYRTPSNFWLQDHRLMGMITGLARLAVIITANSKDNDEFEKALFSRVKMGKVVQAINNNDFELAYSNFRAIEDILMAIIPMNDEYPIHKGLIEEFHHFVKKGSNHFFKDAPMKHWSTLSDTSVSSFESFLKSDVRADLRSN